MKLLNADGTVAVDPKRFPALHRSLTRGLAGREKWAQVAELRKAGEYEKADKLAAELLGVQKEPMTEEKREYLDSYRETHKEEIAAKRRERAERRKRLKELAKAGRRRRRG